jgi:hypothetical protein
VFLSAGFKALLRYEGFDGDSGRDFWCNICVPDIHPVGWCAAGGKPLVPPKCKSNRGSPLENTARIFVAMRIIMIMPFLCKAPFLNYAQGHQISAQ